MAARTSHRANDHPIERQVHLREVFAEPMRLPATTRRQLVIVFSAKRRLPVPYQIQFSHVILVST
jgi:hypothetical protein